MLAPLDGRGIGREARLGAAFCEISGKFADDVVFEEALA